MHPLSAGRIITSSSKQEREALQDLKNDDAGPYAEFFHLGGSKAYMAKKVPNIQRIINMSF